MKKALSLILVLMLMLSALSAAAYAADTDVTATGAFMINSVAVSDVVAPVPDASPSYTAAVPDSAGYGVEDYDERNWYLDGVAWINVTDEKNVNYKTDKFEEGKQYKVCVSLVTIGRNFLFSNDLTGTINGQVAAVTWSAGDDPNPILEYTFTCEYPKVLVSGVTISGTPTARIGDSAADYPPAGTADSEVYSITEKGWMYYNKHDQLYEDFDGIFTEGTYYPCYTVGPGADYRFADSVSVNFSDGTTKTVEPTDGKIFVIGPAVTAVSLTYINSVTVIGATAPVEGVKPDFTAAVLAGKGYQVNRINEDSWISGVRWCDVSADKYLKENDTFVAGKTYQVIVNLKTESDAYQFTDSTTGTLDGQKAVVDLANSHKLYVKLTYTCESKPVILGDVDCDEAVSILDATFIQRKLSGLPVDPFEKRAADTDADGDITILDATFIQRWLSSLSSNPDIGKYITT